MARLHIPGFLKHLATGRNSARRVARPVRNLPEHFTSRARAVLEQAAIEANLSRHSQIEVEHLLLAISQDSDSPVAQLLTKFGFTPTYFRTSLLFSLVLKFPEVAEPGPRYSKVIELAVKAALRLNHPYVGTEHLLLGILELIAESEVVGEVSPLIAKRSEVQQELIMLLQRPAYQPFAYL